MTVDLDTVLQRALSQALAYRHAVATDPQPPSNRNDPSRF